jgi:hypothetical protein
MQTENGKGRFGTTRKRNVHCLKTNNGKVGSDMQIGGRRGYDPPSGTSAMVAEVPCNLTPNVISVLRPLYPPTRGIAATITGRSQRARIRSGIFDFRSVQLYTLSNLELRSLRLFLKIIPIFTYRGCQGYSNLQHTNLSRFLIQLPCMSYY